MAGVHRHNSPLCPDIRSLQGIYRSCDTVGFLCNKVYGASRPHNFSRLCRLNLVHMINLQLRCSCIFAMWLTSHFAGLCALGSGIWFALAIALVWGMLLNYKYLNKIYAYFVFFCNNLVVNVHYSVPNFVYAYTDVNPVVLLQER